MNKIRDPYIRYDKAWKWIFTLYIEEAIEYFHPELYNDINWNITGTMLEQELESIDKSTNKSFNRVDKLIEFTTIENNPICILLHVEVQAFNPQEIAKRMFGYFLQLYLKYPDREIHSLLIYIGSEQSENMFDFQKINKSTQVLFKYTYYNLAAYTEEQLESQNKLISYSLLCTKKIQKNKNKGESNFGVIRKYLEFLENKNIDIEKFNFLRIFAEKLIPFNKEEQNEIKKLFNKNNKLMKQITYAQAKIVREDVSKMLREGTSLNDYLARSLKKVKQESKQEGMQKGLQKGKKEGKKEGKQEGIQEGIQVSRNKSILNLHKKGYTSEQIAELLDFELNIVKEIIASS